MRNSMRTKLIILMVFLASQHEILSALAPWTYCVKKKFTHDVPESVLNYNYMLQAHDPIQEFSQLVCSWNALRPARGYFRFWCRAHTTSTNTWLPWHQMYEWGNGVQQSFIDKKSGASHYIHVRLEMLHKNFADGFQIRVEPVDGADLSCIKMIAVALSDFTRFEAEHVGPKHAALRTIHIAQVPRFSQMILAHPQAEVLCSPTSLCMLTSFLKKKNCDAVTFADNVYDNGLKAYGSWPFNIAHAFEHLQGTVYCTVERLHDFGALHAHLCNNIPVVVSVRGYLKGAPKAYPGGHLLVVVGYDRKNKKVLCHDPAAPVNSKVLKRYDLKNFLPAWERSHRLAYVAERF